MRSTDNIPVLRRLWKQCFEADSSFLDLFFGQGFRLCRTYTDPAQRGHGYAIKLLQEVERHCMENEGMEFFLLRPAGPTLFGYYKRQGYSYNIYRHQETLPLPMIPAEIETSPLSAVRYHSLRRRFYNGTGLVEWPEDTCGYILSYIGYCRGHAVEINGGESYLLSYPFLTGHSISPPHSVSGCCKRPFIHSYGTRLRRRVLTLQTILAPTRQFISLQFCDGVIRSTWNNYLPKYTRRTEISEGDTPGMREASAIVLGRCFVSFIRDSIESDPIRE